MPDIIGMAWYHENQWSRLIASDPTMLTTYAEWLAGAEEDIENWKQRGVTVHKVYVDIDHLIAWAAKNSLPINNRTRCDFCNYILAARHGFTGNV